MSTSLLTPAELELMRVLWARGPSTVREVGEALAEDPPRAYTTLATILRILEEKGFATRARVGRNDVFAAALSREVYEARGLRQVVHDLFADDPVALVRRLVRSESLSADELARLRALVEDLPE